MVYKILLAYFAILGAIIFCILLVAELIIEFIKDRKGDTVGEQVEKLKEAGYEVEVDKGIIFIILPEKEYYSAKFRKGIKDIMRDYSKSYGIRLKDEEDGED